MLDPAAYPDVPSLRTPWAEHERQLRAFVSNLSERDIVRIREYKLLSGQPGASALWQMLQHIVNHGSYHRGQVTTMLRQLGAPPARSMDLIAFYHQQRASA
jgi:uncharacterized damage-inducible protein DinB